MDFALAERRVIDSLSVEVLEMIVRFVPRVYSHDDSSELKTAIPVLPEDDDGGDIVNRHKKPISSVADLRILTQFRLRLLSRKWAALTYQQYASIGLRYYRGRLCFTNGERENALILSKAPSLPGYAQLTELTDEAVCVTERHSLLDHVTRLDVDIGISDWIESVSSVLSKLTSSSVVTQPCELDLTLRVRKMEAAHKFVHDFDTPFQLQFPTLSLRALEFEMDDIVYEPVRFINLTPDSEYYQAACRCLKYFLAAGCSSLVQLGVNFFLLKAAFEAQQPGYACGDPLPEDWACESLRELHVEFLPFGRNYDYASQPKKAAVFAFQARLPKLFPRLQSLKIRGGRPQFDFSVLTQMPALKSLDLSGERLQPKSLDLSGERLQPDCNIQPLPNIRSLNIDCVMPFELSTFAPHADELVFWATRTNALACLAAEIYRTPSSPRFRGLSKLTIVARKYELPFSDRPPFSDLIGLLRALQSLPKLERLKISTWNINNVWSRDGDLSLLGVLPAGLKSLSLKYALVPTDCVQVLPAWLCRWQLNIMNHDGDPHLRENIYKGWLRNLLHQISSIPSLEKVHCRCVAPSFASIVRLAEKWNKGSEYALADLGLSCVTHVQATENCQRIRVEDEFQHEDAVRFRFNITPQAQFERHSLKKRSKPEPSAMKKKLVLVTFENAD